ncbi:hypothetical protein [Rhodovulum iodosum]|nr:hypothetical protein [Rhodovulum robiginosum]
MLALLAAGCAAPPQSQAPAGASQNVAALSQAILALGPGIDPEEADRAARVAYSETRVLAEAYQITDPPLIHNTKVNLGLRPRGLCYHWAMDMEARLAQEDFRTLALHRAIANADVAFRIDHSTVIVSRRGDPYDAGIVLDPWRLGGVLFWAPVREDSRYVWHPRAAVLAEKSARLSRRQALAAR